VRRVKGRVLEVSLNYSRNLEPPNQRKEIVEHAPSHEPFLSTFRKSKEPKDVVESLNPTISSDVSVGS
jgi:hypothetical protein